MPSTRRMKKGQLAAQRLKAAHRISKGVLPETFPDGPEDGVPDVVHEVHKQFLHEVVYMWTYLQIHRSGEPRADLTTLRWYCNYRQIQVNDVQDVLQTFACCRRCATLQAAHAEECVKCGPPTIDYVQEQELAGQELAGQELAGQELAGQELAGQELAGQELHKQELPKQEEDFVNMLDHSVNVEMIDGSVEQQQVVEAVLERYAQDVETWLGLRGKIKMVDVTVLEEEGDMVMKRDWVWEELEKKNRTTEKRKRKRVELD